MKTPTLEERVARLEAMQRESGAMAVAVHDLVVTLMRTHPDRASIVQTFIEDRERFMALALNSTAPTDEWLQLLQLAVEELSQSIVGRPPPPRS